MRRAEEPDLRLLGLAARAGALVYGTDLVRRAVRAGSVRLAIVASDISENTRDKLRPLRKSGGVAVIEGPDRGELGAMVGRGPLSVVGVTDATFASRMLPSGASTSEDVEDRLRAGDR
ncbi:MAG TPA: ribosomal L7Ae/L30e/S12e/Gadd45 family protein [Longimicrobiales bacterium]|nr:ribosomal L7Ae/L30e/S12e/Gadd45 family protein [Longimicrobiales bacterium]